MEWYGIQHWHIKQFVIHELCRSGKLKRTELHFQQHKFTVSGSQGNRRSHPSYHQPTYHSSKAATTSKTSHNLIGTQLSKWLCTARQHLLLPPMAVQEQRPVDGGEVEEHDQQNQQVINESKEPQHTFRENVNRAQHVNCAQCNHHHHPRPEHKWESPLGIH